MLYAQTKDLFPLSPFKNGYSHRHYSELVS
jgi:hypothetical protein